MIKPSPDTPVASPGDDDPADSGSSGDGDPRSGSTPSGARSNVSADAIGRRLKCMFDGILAEPVPDRLRELIEELARKSDTQR